MIPFKYDEATRSLTIGKRQGEFSGMLKERTFRIVTVSPTQMQAFDPDASGKPSLTTEANRPSGFDLTNLRPDSRKCVHPVTV